MDSFEGRTALVTGASGGIGEAFARRLATEGADLVLVARGKEKLQALAAALKKKHGIAVTVIPKDLTQSDAAQVLFEETNRRHLTVDVLVNNAGFGIGGPFLESKLERTLEMIQLNVSTLVALTRLYLPGMVERRGGAVVNVASTAAFQPTPYMGAAYGATKAFVLSFSEALWEECRTSGVTVMALCPGPTSTGFFDVAGMAEGSMPVGAQTPDEVVEVALQGLKAKRPSVISGWMNYALAQSSRLAPREIVARVTGLMFRRPPR